MPGRPRGRAFLFLGRLCRHSSGCRGGGRRIAEIVVSDWREVVLEFVDQRNPGRNVQLDNIGFRDVVEILHQRPKAVAMGSDNDALARATASCQYGRNRSTVSLSDSVKGSCFKSSPR